MVYFDYVKIWRQLKRWWLKRQILRNPIKVTTTQHEAQQLFEDPIFDPSMAYSNFCLLYITMVFFQPVLPIGALTGFVALVLTYFAYKKKLLRDSKRPVMISEEVPLVTLYLLNMTPLCYGVTFSLIRSRLRSTTRSCRTRSRSTHGQYWVSACFQYLFHFIC